MYELYNCTKFTEEQKEFHISITIRKVSTIVSNTKIQTVDHKFLVSGHLFLECDQGLCSHREMQKEELFLFLYLVMGMHSWRKLAEKLQYLK